MFCHLIVNNFAAGHNTTCVWSRECDMKCKVELTAPLKCTGDISARYIGAKPAFNPELIPMKNRPMIIISKEPAAFEAPAKKLHDLNWSNHEQALWVLQRKETVFCVIHDWGLCTFKYDSNCNQHIVEQEATLPAKPLCHNTSDGTTYHTPYTEDGYSNGPDHGHFGLVHNLACPVVLCLCNPFLYQLEQRWGTWGYTTQHSLYTNLSLDKGKPKWKKNLMV